MSGKSRQNAIKTMILTDEVGRMLFCGATASGSTADITQANSDVTNPCSRPTLRHHAQHRAFQQARVEQRTDQWQQRYQHRASVEGTIDQGVRAFGLRRSRYRGLAKTNLPHLLTAAGINFNRLNAWWDDTPLAATRRSHFAALRPAA
ncbi:transposase [Umezawaea sp. Da 62-37]|uniref:transposase n=1 Tax=Umezawaea sp. Da 62-37 TaxID=3075927 RepID=UPI0037DC9B73